MCQERVVIIYLGNHKCKNHTLRLSKPKIGKMICDIFNRYQDYIVDLLCSFLHNEEFHLEPKKTTSAKQP